MELRFRTVDPHNPHDMEGFNRLMDDLTRHADNAELLQSRITEANANPDKYLMVAENAATGDLVGSLLGVCFGDFCEACNPVMVIENVVTRSDCRNQGVARAMFREIEAWGKAKQAAYVILCSANHRLEAHQFYKAIGYDEIKGFKKYL